MGLAFAAMWSSAFTSARIIVASAPPLTTLAFRFLISGLIAVIIARLMKQTWHLTRAQWRATIIFGICQNGLYLGLNFVAMQWVEASLAAIIASTMPLLVALAGWLFLKDAPKPVAMVGLAAGIAGVALVMGTRLGQGVDLTGVILCLVGVLALTVATMALRGALSGGNYMMIVGLQMLIGSAFLWPFGLAFESLEVIWSPQLVAAFVYTTLVPGLAATFIWVLLVNRIGAVRAATFHFLNPFLGVAFAALLLGEQLRTSDFIGVLVIAAGILAVQLSHVVEIRKMQDKT
ncbi:threonine/homoserine efflux transporter RhtA [Pelagimonas varians]|uniref:Putative DMT superfamily transporter inner membrane protein n=2 Tax=Pelagimonas varians TaxID=696760 RepID=A0A238KRB3_9RHOB|nr:threonine/homoserine efflux transporter RhtA [Pelagimonas varians]SMX45268.1 putative DMT superfamily transporter inner membrane protein [Pelagimonas varians]